MNDSAAIGKIEVEADPGGGRCFGNGGRCRKSSVTLGGRRTGGRALLVGPKGLRLSEGRL